MSAEQTVPTLDRAYALRPSLLTPGRQRQPVFWLALLAAALAHAVLVVGISQAPPNYLGDPSGNAEAIDVEIVDEGQLRAMSSPQAPAEAPPSPPPAAQAAAPAQEPPPPEPETTPEAVPETAPETAPPQKSAARPTSEAEEAQAAPPPEALPKPAPPQEDVKKESPPKKESAAKPKPKTAIKPPAKLDLSVPLNLTMQGAASGGGGAASTRPPGITRSGANDRFGRDVIRALKKTMPPSDGVTGKVKVRIFLNERGNVAWVRVVNSSGDRLLDDSVTFSVYQSSFPFPPKGATVADRTFLVTYIYR
jgi:protein TonB